jgi:tRNA G37 N-methylase Trm5
MDELTIQKIAAEVVARLPFGDRYSLVVNVVVAALVGAVAALGTSYFRTRGQNLATKHDFDELQKQLRANETIKAEVGQKDRARREWTNLRRTKLEALLTVTHDCQAYLERYRRKAMRNQVPEDRDPVRELSTATVYFPELETQIAEYENAYLDEFVVIGDLWHNLSTTQQPDARQRLVDQYRADMNPRYKRILDASANLRDAARALLRKIMDVDEHP